MKVSKTIEIETGIFLECSCDMYEEMYGQDADGNRGELRSYFEEVTATLSGVDIYEVLAQSYKDTIDAELQEQHEYDNRTSDD